MTNNISQELSEKSDSQAGSMSEAVNNKVMKKKAMV